MDGKIRESMSKDKLYTKSPKVVHFKYKQKKHITEMSTREKKRLNKNNIVINKQQTKDTWLSKRGWLVELAFIIVAILVYIVVIGG